MADGQILKLRLSLMGRPVRNYTFDQDVVSVGRDPEADVFVDNPGVSRDHFRIERTAPGEYRITDLGSANGTFVNDQMVNASFVRDNDVVRFGKYTLWVGVETDRRARPRPVPPPATTSDTARHTVVLSRAEVSGLTATAPGRPLPPVTPEGAVEVPPPQRWAVRETIVGMLIGGTLAWFAVRLWLRP